MCLARRSVILLTECVTSQGDAAPSDLTYSSGCWSPGCAVRYLVLLALIVDDLGKASAAITRDSSRDARIGMQPIWSPEILR